MFPYLLYTVSCRVEFDLAQSILQRSSWELFQEHVDAWRKTWDDGRLEVVLLVNSVAVDMYLKRISHNYCYKFITRSHDTASVVRTTTKVNGKTEL